MRSQMLKNHVICRYQSSYYIIVVMNLYPQNVAMQTMQELFSQKMKKGSQYCNLLALSYSNTYYHESTTFSDSGRRRRSF